MIAKVIFKSKTLKTGLPQGSLLGHFAFPFYTAPLFEIARSQYIQVHMYADDTQLYLPFHSGNYRAAIKPGRELFGKHQILDEGKSNKAELYENKIYGGWEQSFSSENSPTEKT